MKKKFRMTHFFSMFFLAGILFLAAGCKQEPLVPIIPAPVTIAVAPYNQPTHNAQLLAGYIPENQDLASANQLADYDVLLKTLLEKTKRSYIFLTQEDLNISIQKDSKNRNNVLATWAKIAQNKGADYLIVPQILDHEEKYGVGNDVYSPARLISDFYLIKAIRPSKAALEENAANNSIQTDNEEDAADGYLQARSHYKEISFIQVNVNGEDYVSPRQHQNIIYFVRESILKMIREFHLTIN